MKNKPLHTQIQVSLTIRHKPRNDSSEEMFFVEVLQSVSYYQHNGPFDTKGVSGVPHLTDNQIPKFPFPG